MPERHRWLVAPEQPFDLDAVDPGATTGSPGDKAATKAALQDLWARLADLQVRLYAEGERSLLIVLQAMDAAGKDSTIKKVFQGLNPLGVRAVSFKAPTEEELEHDFLWRVHRHVPRAGEIAVFNRSHYEDVLVVRVRHLAPESVWRDRYQHIRAFESLIAESGTAIVKVMLHISYEEQRKRLQARVDDPTKRWKFRAGDLDERRLWGDYMSAFAEALAETSTDRAPWYCVPANRKWYRNWAVLQILTETLEALDPRFPDAVPGIEGTVVE